MLDFALVEVGVPLAVILVAWLTLRMIFGDRNRRNEPKWERTP